jgi:hypothetical protein
MSVLGRDIWRRAAFPIVPILGTTSVLAAGWEDAFARVINLFNPATGFTVERFCTVVTF